MSRNKNIRAFWQLAAIFFIGAGVFLVAGPASAQLQLLGKAVGLDCEWALGETFGLGAFTQLAINALKLIWGILGSLALVMFVWGGFLWLTARGEEQQIKQGWDTLINAVIGLVIVLGSWVIINTIVLSLTNPGSWDVGKLFGNKKWTELVESNAVCVKIAARTPGYIAPASSGSPVGAGVCCTESASNTDAMVGLNEGACKTRLQLLSDTEDSWWGAQKAKAYYCSVGNDNEVCGEEIVESKFMHEQYYWKDNKCPSSMKIFTLANGGEECADTKICKQGFICDVNNSDGRKQCVKQDEDGYCCIELTGEAGGGKRYFLESSAKKRKDCKTASSSTANVNRDSVTWSITTQTKAFCPGGQTTDCAEQNNGRDQVRINSVGCFIY